jgi:hypothetical protein
MRYARPKKQEKKKESAKPLEIIKVILEILTLAVGIALGIKELLS